MSLPFIVIGKIDSISYSYYYSYTKKKSNC